ncbi:undecaprenyl/decaprenyl-phosphate alpha-N-acetylglucosaminyl 1-phosphate transferase [Candidatus Saganbacteria bacterium]|nr:undecaprenyl/decaprenyl-phosphate alpha-N-acetylglucosaminyl 1-phosphate transferase [Candidatus Saganbacteria bacterium]
MLIYLIVIIIAFLAAMVLTPLVKWLGIILGFLDKPGARKIHAKPTPLLGGVAIFLAFAITSAIFLYYQEYNFWMIIWGLVFVLFGLIDDKGINIRARYKIWSHLFFAGLFVITAKTGLHFVRIEWINFLLSVGFITFMTNSLNMLDGMDGLVGGISAIVSFFFFALAMNNGQPDLAILSLIILGACLGFLRYNFNPASIFLGEAGSTFLGYILAVMAIKLNVLGLWDVALTLHVTRLQIISFVIPLIILGIPIFDTYFVFANRFLHRIKFSQPGKDHTHHRIHLRGFSQKATVLTLYAVQFILGAVALAMINTGSQQFFALFGIVAIIAVVAWNFLTRVEVYS